ncbi:MAG: 3-methyl-2-oxobutanoate hydroxymethyltransferase [Legionella sp.]|jgi:3-methyl-2-oxobutanoate hydroxymethyltransferase
MKIHDFKRKKLAGTKISMLTCYDYPSACIVAESHIDCVLVGDSVAMVVHGYDTTIMATLEMMVLHTKAVARGVSNQFIVADLPFLSHKVSQAQTINNVHQLMQAGAHALKIEGADADTCKTIRYLVEAGVPIMGHIGLTPQHIHQLGGFRVQGKNQQQEEILMQQALNLEQAGCFAVVLECIPQHLATNITESLSIPTIGIGAGLNTDGQVLVWHDLLGLQTEINPKFVKRYTQGKEIFLDAINTYVQQVQQESFPTAEHAF